MDPAREEGRHRPRADHLRGPNRPGFGPAKTSCTGRRTTVIPAWAVRQDAGDYRRVLVGAKTRRFAPPPHGGAEGLDPDSARARKAAMGERPRARRQSARTQTERQARIVNMSGDAA